MPESASTYEQQMAELERQFSARKQELQQKAQQENSEAPSDKEIVDQVAKEAISQHTPTVSEQSSDQNLTSDEMEVGAKVKELESLLNQKNNIDAVIKEAAKTRNAAVIDEFHKVLTGHLFEELVQKKALEQVS